MLTAVVYDNRPITVAAYTGSPAQRPDESQVSHEAKVSGDQIQHQNHPVPDQQRVSSEIL